ncbi:MAG: peptide ABC transporter substrate-binding protein [Chloroflexi bacterium]|nr:peptide ABC transporter substrate-binding protein [Chloroflexota bacterium]
MQKFTRLTALLLLVAMLFAVVGGAAAQDGPKILVTGRQMGCSDIPTLDPALAEDVPSVQVITELFPSLLRLHEETVEVQNGLASYSVSEDGLTYTFNILPNISWVRYNADSGAVEQVTDDSGAPLYVTAQDFAYGMLRTLDPVTAAPYQLVWAPWVAGGVEFAGSGEASAEDQQALRDAVGIVVVDDWTLEVTVPQVAAPTPLIYAQWFAIAQPQAVVEEFGDFWIDPENIVTYGPFALKEWVRGDGGSLTMIKNPFWEGTPEIPAPALDEVQFRFLDETVQLTEFEAGNLQVSEAPAASIDRINSDPALSAALHVAPGTCTYYYGFNTLVAPFDDARARRAFSMAIDRQAIVDNVTREGQIPASLFALPSLVAAPTSEAFPDLGIKTDVEAARALWDEYLADVGATADSFQISIYHNDSALHASVAQAVQQMWAENLGVNAQITTADFATYLDQRGNYPVYRAAWCFDYPDAHNFYYDVPFHSDLIEENDTHWANEEFDSLIDQAFLLTDNTERAALYAQADNILVNTDAAIAPIYYYVTNDLTASNVVRTYSNITREYYEKWDLTD